MSKMQTHFNTVWQYFVVEGNPLSRNKDNSPQYRGEDGAKCTIGVLIPDALYKQAMESLSATVLLARWPFMAREVFYERDNEGCPDMADFLQELQVAHDKLVLMPKSSNIKAELETLAERYDLCCLTN